MRRTLIVALLCVNGALLLALVINAGETRATAQVFGGAADYLLATGQISAATEALYVVDLARQRLMAFHYDRTTRRMTPITGRRLQDDFRQTSGSTGGRP